MEVYLSLRTVHILCAAIAGMGFMLLGIWMLRGSPLLDHGLARTLPHINDTLLLTAAISMAWMARHNPLDHAWLMAKLTALLVYILLGSIALRRGRTRKVRALAFAGALISFALRKSTICLMREITGELTNHPWIVRILLARAIVPMTECAVGDVQLLAELQVPLGLRGHLHVRRGGSGQATQVSRDGIDMGLLKTPRLEDCNHGLVPALAVAEGAQLPGMISLGQAREPGILTRLSALPRRPEDGTQVHPRHRPLFDRDQVIPLR